MELRRLRVLLPQYNQLMSLGQCIDEALLTLDDLDKDRAFASPKMRTPCDRRDSRPRHRTAAGAVGIVLKSTILNSASPKDAPPKGGASST
jgi:hypothetical protein